MSNTTRGNTLQRLTLCMIAATMIAMTPAVASAQALSGAQQAIAPLVRGRLFEFAPQVDEYLKTHLFGDIFGRDNLDWQSREVATVSALAAMSGVESQLQSHIRISLNTGLTGAQLHQLADVLAERGQPEAARRTRAAIQQVLPDQQAER